MKKISVVRLTTEGDCEGRSVQTKGHFIGSIGQIITYCIENNIKPYYYFKAEYIEVIDVSDLKEKYQVTVGQYGRIIFKTDQQLHDDRIRKEALSKLTDEEKRLLGVRE